MNQTLSGAAAGGLLARQITARFGFGKARLKRAPATRRKPRTREDMWETAMAILLMLSVLVAVGFCFGSAVFSLASTMPDHL